MVIDVLDGIKGSLALREETEDSPAAPAAEQDGVDRPIGKRTVAAG
jgi:hypothetical protein